MNLQTCTINERIRYLRKEYLGLSQEAFSNKLGISQTKASFLERDNNTITDSTIKLISSVFHISEEWIRFGTRNIQANISSEQEIAQLVAKIVSDSDRPKKKEALLLAARIINNDIFYNVIAEYIRTLKNGVDPE